MEVSQEMLHKEADREAENWQITRVHGSQHASK
jgi:hypothetical protein